MVEWQFSPAFSPLLLLEAVEGLEGTINFIPKGCLQNDSIHSSEGKPLLLKHMQLADINYCMKMGLLLHNVF